MTFIKAMHKRILRMIVSVAAIVALLLTQPHVLDMNRLSVKICQHYHSDSGDVVSLIPIIGDHITALRYTDNYVNDNYTTDGDLNKYLHNSVYSLILWETSLTIAILTFISAPLGAKFEVFLYERKKERKRRERERYEQ